MVCVRSVLLAGCLAATAMASGRATAFGSDSQPAVGTLADPSRIGLSNAAVPGREDDAKIAAIAFRLARAGTARCPRLVPGLGLVLQHLSQYQPADRAGQASRLALDHGPGVAAVVPGGPAAAAGVVPGDVVLAIDGRPLPGEPGLAGAFNQVAARARDDAVSDLIEAQAMGPFPVSLLRHGASVEVRLTAVPVCPSRVHLARSAQVNAYADGVHVFLTSRLVALAGSDDQLGFIIAHEMAHNILGHAALMRAAEVGRGLGRALGAKGSLVRRTEDEADALGAELMLDAGFDPVAGAEILRRGGAGEFRIGFLDDHRSPADRIASVRAVAAARSGR